MPGRTRRHEWIITQIDALKTWSDQNSERILVGALILVSGALLAFLAAQFEEAQRIEIGNTGGTLSALISVDGTRIMVGAGPSRSHAADFLGRSTRPWDREIDLLVLPGWDDRHTVGALGLLERRSVQSIVVIGLPGDEPSWTLLDRESERADVPIVFIDRPHRLEMTNDTRFILAGSQGDDSGAWIRFEHRGKRIDFIDSNGVAFLNPDPSAFSPSNDHVVINMRSSHQPGASRPQLLIMPRPHWQHDFSNIDSPAWAGIDRNERLTLRLTDNTIRLPLEIVETRLDTN